VSRPRARYDLLELGQFPRWSLHVHQSTAAKASSSLQYGVRDLYERNSSIDRDAEDASAEVGQLLAPAKGPLFESEHRETGGTREQFDDWNYDLDASLK